MQNWNTVFMDYMFSLGQQWVLHEIFSLRSLRLCGELFIFSLRPLRLCGELLF
jgi:hypothetical protein